MPTIANPTLTCTSVSGETNTGMKCAKPEDTSGNVYFTCARWRIFYPNCGRNLNGLCNPQAGAYVPAITICTQRLF